MSNNKQSSIEFANSLSDLNGISLFANECERFGMTWGCKEYCPVYERGECEIQEENKKMFEKYYNETYGNTNGN